MIKSYITAYKKLMYHPIPLCKIIYFGTENGTHLRSSDKAQQKLINIGQET